MIGASKGSSFFIWLHRRHVPAAVRADRRDPPPAREVRARAALPALRDGPQALRAGLPPLRRGHVPARSVRGPARARFRARRKPADDGAKPPPERPRIRLLDWLSAAFDLRRGSAAALVLPTLRHPEDPTHHARRRRTLRGPQGRGRQARLRDPRRSQPAALRRALRRRLRARPGPPRAVRRATPPRATRRPPAGSASPSPPPARARPTSSPRSPTPTWTRCRPSSSPARSAPT